MCGSAEKKRKEGKREWEREKCRSKICFLLFQLSEGEDNLIFCRWGGEREIGGGTTATWRMVRESRGSCCCCYCWQDRQGMLIVVMAMLLFVVYMFGLWRGTLVSPREIMCRDMATQKNNARQRVVWMARYSLSLGVAWMEMGMHAKNVFVWERTPCQIHIRLCLHSILCTLWLCGC